MALPSALTIGSAAAVIVAGVGIAAWAGGSWAASPAHAPATDDPVAGVSSSDKPPTQTNQPKAHHHKDHHEQAVPKTLVEVFNNSGIHGLAGDKAAILEGAGWNVAATDNWYGDIPANTVYYPPSYRSQAKQLAKVLDIHRLRPAVSPMQFDRLTVILTSN